MGDPYPRRLRRTPALRRAFAEHRLDPARLVLPLFVKQGLDSPVPVDAMPGVQQYATDGLGDVVDRAVALGVTSFLLFGIPAEKDPEGAASWDPDGPVPAALADLRGRFGNDVVLWADVCACEYTDHGHCGPLVTAADGRTTVDNDRAVAGYVRASIAYADAGADLVAPSGMMDGQVAALRAGLDDAGHRDVGVVAYAAKFASAFYGPFREAAESGLADGDRADHQLDPANRREAAREVALDVAEGADAVMVKPAGPYLDVVADTAAAVDVPVVAYQVSGEYAMVKAAAERGWLDGDAAMRESVLGIHRAGADLVITYAAIDLFA